MNQQCEILNSKLSAPRVTGTVPRKKLVPLLKTILEHKITIVTAGAGFGKSTIIAQACENIRCDKSWYRLEPGDADPVTFINYIVAGIQKSYPDFGERTLSILNSKTTIVEMNHNILSILLNEIEAVVSQDFVIVLDDCHVISENQIITESLQYLIDHLPKCVHLIMMSRIESALSLSKLRTSLEINEITQKELEFSADEIRVLYDQLFGVMISPKSINNLYTRTEGWVSGLILFYHLSKGKNNDEIEDLLLEIKSDHKVFREYMGENVYEDQPANIREFLIQTSVFNQLDADFCNKFLGIDDADTILSQLEQNHLFTTSVDNEERIYCYHHLFQEFLRNKLVQEKGSSIVNEIHYRSAKIFEERFKEDEALYHYLEAKKYADVFRLLKTVGYKFFSQGRHTNLDELLKKIPDQYMQTEPWALALKAKLYTSRGQFAKAIQYSNRAQENFIANEMFTEAEMTLADSGTAYYMMGDFSRAEETFIKVIENNSVDEFTLLQILGNLVFTTAYFGNFEQSDKYFDEAELKLEQFQAVMDIDKYQMAKIWLALNYGFRWNFAGDSVKSIFYSDSVYHDIEELGSPPFRAYYTHLLSINQIFLGKIKDARNTVNNGLSELCVNGFQGTQEAWLRLNSAFIHLIEKDYDEALCEIEKGLVIHRLGGNKWGEASLLVLLSIVNQKLGDVEKIKQNLFDGLQIANEIKIPWVEGKVYSFAAIDMMNKGDYGQADMFLKLSEQLLSYSTYERCLLLVVRAQFYSVQEEEQKTIDSLLEALGLGEKFSYGAWIFFIGIEKLTYYYVKIYSSGQFNKYLISLFSVYWDSQSDELYLLRKSKNKKIKIAALEIISQMPKEKVPSLEVVCFGKFKVFAGKREIKSADWKSNKAREIFKYLVFSRNKAAVPRDVLLELIWPEQDCEKTIKRLHVALPALRKTLEPNVRRGESSYLVRENDLYRIEFGEEGFVDVDLFIREIKLAEKETEIEKKLTHYLQAESYYNGDLFAEDIYTDWSFEERENLKRKYLHVLDEIISIYRSTNDNDKCIQYSEKYLEIDDYSEGIYNKLMQYYYEAGNYNMAVKTYEKCYKKVVEDLGCPISEEVTGLYDKLVNK